jgi:geranylgeranyl pyrophosphate synthase
VGCHLKEEIPSENIKWNMNSESDLTEQVTEIIEEKGRVAIEKARNEILSMQTHGGEVTSALAHFAKVTLTGGLPVFPVLLTLSCEAVGGKTEKTTAVSAALTLMAGAADIHDDIIDQSKVKYSKKTVFGKFGASVALLAGDALLIQGSTLLQQECESLTRDQRTAILALIPEALFEISNAEAQESHLMKSLNAKPQEYLEIIRMKAVVPELHCKIGAIMGNASKANVEALGSYGRTFGVTSLVRDEFGDLYEYPELENRIKNECLPLPMLYALQNPKLRNEIEAYIESGNFERKTLNRLKKLVLESDQVEELRKDLYRMVADGVNWLESVGNNMQLKLLKSLLKVTTASM